MQNQNSIRSIFISLFVVAIIFLLGCRNHIDSEMVKNEIVSLLQQERTAHIEKNAAMFLSRFDSNFILVNMGEVNPYDPTAFRQHFDNYLQSSDFIKWDDTENPIIRISDDGTMAYAIVQKLVILKNKSENDRIDTTHFAWVSIYTKKNSEWKLVCNASTKR